MLRFLLVLALLVGLGTPAHAVTPKLRGADPLALVGWWRDAATGATVVIDPSRIEVRTPTRTTEGSWVGDNAGRYVLHCHNLEHEDMAMMATIRTV